MGLNDDLAAKLAFEPADRKPLLEKWREAEGFLCNVVDKAALDRASIAFSKCYLAEGIGGDMIGAALKAAGIPITEVPGFDGRAK